MQLSEDSRQELMRDLEQLHSLIVRYARGESEVKRARDRLGGAIEVKMALFRSISSDR